MPIAYNISLPKNCINLSTASIKTMELLEDEYIIQNITQSLLGKRKIPIDQNWHQSRYGFALSDSEIKIFNLHRLAWYYFLQTTENHCVILENYPIKLESPIPKIDLPSNNWDILFPYEDSDVLSTKDELESIKILNYNPRERKEYEPYLLGRKWGSFFYFLSRQGARKLLTIKIISQNVDDEILLLSHENKLNVYCQKFPFFKYQNRPKILNLDREKQIYSTIMSNDAWKGNNRKMAKKILKTIASVASKLKIELLLEGGTLLGFIQHNGLMPWDDDIDLGIHDKDINRFVLELKKITGLNISKLREGHTGKPFYKIWSSNGLKIDGWQYNFPFIDLWLYKIKDNDIQYINGIIHRDSALKKFTQVTFEEAKFYVPFNALQCLDGRYKTWRKTIRVYQWCHRKEDNSFFPLTVRIKTDVNGKMLAPLFQLLKHKNFRYEQ